MRAVLVWPVEPVDAVGRRRSLAALVRDATADVPATCARMGWRATSEPRRWAIVPGTSMAGFHSYDEVLRCEIDVEMVRFEVADKALRRDVRATYQWRSRNTEVA